MSSLRPIDRWFIDEVLPFEKRYLGAALRLARDAEEARDIVQEAYVKLFGIDGWSAIQSPPGYVLRMIRNIAIERMRRAQIVRFQQLAEIDSHDIPDDAPDPFREASGRHEVRRLKAALESLPERYRTVVIRRRLGEESPRQIAQATGQSLSTLEKRLARGMQLLTAALSWDGAASGRRKAPPVQEDGGEEAERDEAAHR